MTEIQFEDFMKIDIKDPDKWEKICAFVGIKEVPSVPFPVANTKKKPPVVKLKIKLKAWLNPT